MGNNFMRGRWERSGGDFADGSGRGAPQGIAGTTRSNLPAAKLRSPSTSEAWRPIPRPARTRNASLRICRPAWSRPRRRRAISPTNCIRRFWTIWAWRLPCATSAISFPRGIPTLRSNSPPAPCHCGTAVWLPASTGWFRKVYRISPNMRAPSGSRLRSVGGRVSWCWRLPTTAPVSTRRPARGRAGWD